jgi:nascent polypeptide-associated complex subunit alpha
MQGQKIFQVIGGKVTEKAPERSAPSASQPVVSEADVQLVAGQTGKSVEEARKALEECEGDLAKAILLLQS